MDQRSEFVHLARSGGVPMAELCRRFEVSRQTGYQLLRRFEAEGQAGLEPRSRRPHASPRQVSAALEQRVVALRCRHPAWGSRKIGRRLRDLGVADVPATSTITDILHRHGLIDPAQSPCHRPCQRFERAAPNELWQMDFKGHFATDRGRCHPLTVLDDHCRYNLGLRACADETEATVRAELTALFRRHGLPDAILADNGSPWGTGQPGARYTALGVWLLQLGVRLHHGRPRHPQTQGKEERFHRTLSLELLQHNRFADIPAAQGAFDAWRSIYNEQRPHEALGLDVPASRYQPSTRCFPSTLPEPQYDEADAIRRVTRDGYITFQGKPAKLSQAFAGQNVALRPANADGTWNVFFSRFLVGQINLRQNPEQTQPVRDVPAHLSGMSPV